MKGIFAVLGFSNLRCVPISDIFYHLHQNKNYTDVHLIVAFLHNCWNSKSFWLGRSQVSSNTWKDITKKNECSSPLILVRRNLIKLNIIQEISFVFHRFDRKNRGCLWDRLHPSPYFYIAFALVVAIPATITLLSYFAIYKHVIESRKKVNYICPFY